MITALITAISLTQSLPMWTPDELKDSKKYEVTYNMTRRGVTDLQFQRVTDGVIIDFKVQEDENPERLFPLRNAITTLRDTPLDGYPLGINCEILVRMSHFDVKVADGRERLELSVWSPLVGTGRFKEQRGDDFSSEEAWIVSLAREAFSKFAARRAGTIAQIKVNGQNVDTFGATGTGVAYVDLEQYMSAKNSTVSRNDTAKRYAYRLSGQDYVALLGTSKIKKGRSWTRMLDVTMMLNGRVFVPLDSLN